MDYYGWSVVFGTLYSLLTAFASWALFFMVTFPFENQSPGEARDDDWLIPVAIVMFVSALFVFIGVMTVRAWLVTAAFGLGAVVGILALRYAVMHWSDHGDGQLIATGLGIGLSGLLAAVLSPRAAHASGPL